MSLPEMMWTIVFLNNSVEDPTPTVWIMKTKEEYENWKTEVENLPWCKIIQSGLSLVK